MLRIQLRNRNNYRVFLLLVIAPLYLQQCHKQGEVRNVTNYMKRVIAKDGLNVREAPAIDAKSVGLLPFGKTVWIRKEFTKEVNINGTIGNWLFINAYFGRDASGKPRPILEGWIFNAHLGELLMSLPNGFKDFKAGCLYGCNVCGAIVFDPDGFFLRSFNCHAPLETGRWLLQGAKIAACIGSACNPRDDLPNTYLYTINPAGDFFEFHKGETKPLIAKMWYWESGGWEEIPSRNHTLKPPM